jgi:protein TonB
MQPRPTPLVVLCVLSLALAGCDEKPRSTRKQQLVKLLPDTPPPPPPPPKPEDRPPPKPEDKPQPQDAPKPAEVPQQQALKSDETAGDGPGSGLAAGAVTRDYTDQKIGATIGGSSGEDSATRLAANTYAHAATRALNEYLVRDKEVKRLDYKVHVALWLTPVGSLQRVELMGSTGDEQTDLALRAALGRFPGIGNPPPARLPQPMRLLVSNRMMG